MSSNTPAYALGIISVYSLGIFPLLLQHSSDHSKDIVAICSVVQILCSWLRINLQGLAFFGALSSCIVLVQPEVSYILVGGCFGSYYSQFLNGVESPEKALQLEFVAQLLFLIVATIILVGFDSVECVIVVSGICWFLLTPAWSPIEGLQAGTNWLFLLAWSILSVCISGLLLAAVFIVGGVYDDDSENRAILVGLSLLLFGGCISSISFDKSRWYKAMLFGCIILALTALSASILPWSTLVLASLAYCLGIGIGCVMVAVRSAYAGHYGILLGVQRAAEAVPAILLALTSERFILYVSTGASVLALFIFWRVSQLERQKRIIADEFELL